MKKVVLTGIVVGLMLTLGVVKGLCLEPEVEGVSNIDQLQDIENPEAKFKIELWTDKEDGVYKPGDSVKLYVKSNKDCYLTIFNVGTSGKVHIIFPNQYHKDNFVKAGVVYTVPPEGAGFILKAEKPAGEELVKAVATLAKVPLLEKEDIKPAGPVQEVTKPEEQLAKDIAVILKPVNKAHWTTVEKIIKISE